MSSPKTYKSGLPKKLRVSHVCYKVSYNASLPDSTEGETGSSELIIEMNPMFDIGRQRATFLHEVLHAVFDTADLSGLTRRSEEEIISRITPVLLETLRKNPELLKFLRGKK